MNLKREMIAVHERLDKIEAAIAGLLISPPPVTSTKTVKKATTKKKAKKKSDPTSVKTTSDQIAQVEM